MSTSSPRQPADARGLRQGRASASQAAGHRAPQAAQRAARRAHQRCSSRTSRRCRYQIQEMLRIEKIFEEEGIESEIEAYAPLVPDGSNWKATLLIEYPDPNERKRELGAADRRRGPDVRRGRGPRRASTPSPTRTSTARTTRRPRRCTSCASSSPQATREAVRAGAGVRLGCDHTNYPAHVTIAPETLASLAGDLR